MDKFRKPLPKWVSLDYLLDRWGMNARHEVEEFYQFIESDGLRTFIKNIYFIEEKKLRDIINDTNLEKENMHKVVGGSYSYLSEFLEVVFLDVRIIDFGSGYISPNAYTWVFFSEGKEEEERKKEELLPIYIPPYNEIIGEKGDRWDNKTIIEMVDIYKEYDRMVNNLKGEHGLDLSLSRDYPMFPRIPRTKLYFERENIKQVEQYLGIVDHGIKLKGFPPKRKEAPKHLKEINDSRRLSPEEVQKTQEALRRAKKKHPKFSKSAIIQEAAHELNKSQSTIQNRIAKYSIEF